MDSYGFIDNIQVEKANALARYNLFNNISKFLRLIEVFIVIVLISWSSTRLPTVFKVTGEYLYAFSAYVLHQHVVFLVGNVIVVICYVFSGQNDVGNVTVTVRSEIVEENKYMYRSTGSIESARSTDDNESGSNTEPVRFPVTESPEMKHTVLDEKCEKTYLKVEPEVTAVTAIKKATKQIEKFQRTQSVKLRRELTVKHSGELRRSVTERRRSDVTSCDLDKTSSFETVERMSSEEFRLKIEAFILKQQSMMVEEAYHR